MRRADHQHSFDPRRIGGKPTFEKHAEQVAQGSQPPQHGRDELAHQGAVAVGERREARMGVSVELAIERPVLIGHSRKRFLKKLLGREVEERNAGTLGVSIALAAQGTDILRVHDVRATRDALLAWQTVLNNRR